MGIRISRSKPRSLLLSYLYRAQKLLPLSSAARFRLFLNLEWIFDRLAHEYSFGAYSADNHPVRRHSRAFLLKFLNENDSVLDLGCNTGDIGRAVAQKAKRVVGIDYNAEAIKRANNADNPPNLRFVSSEALDYLQKNTEPFDVLLLSHILEHLDDPKSFIRRFKDYFRNLYIEVPDFDRSYLNQYRQDQQLPLIYTDLDHVSEFDRDELNALLEDCGIEVIAAEYRYGVQKLWCNVKR
ncbi:MAG: class I SAM-dependent methyltransferase [Bacteroidota bacterium]